ncbi:MAG: hypothetical protein ACYS0I_06500 [Planctomycetota bacterium]
MKWIHGAPMSRLSVALFSGFLFFFGLGAFLLYVLKLGSVGVLPLLAAFLIGIPLTISWILDLNRYQKSLRKEYERNSPKYPSVFTGEPADVEPVDIDDEQWFSLYDRDTAGYIGDISGSELRFLIEHYEEWGLGRNDFLVMPETVEGLRNEGLAQSTAKLLEAALEKRKDAIEVRWAERGDGGRGGLDARC